MVISTSRSLPCPPGFLGSWSHLAERGPFVLTLGTEAFTGVCVSEKHSHRAELVE